MQEIFLRNLSRMLYLCYCSHTTIPRHTSQNSIAADNLDGYVTENGVNSNVRVYNVRNIMIVL